MSDTWRPGPPRVRWCCCSTGGRTTCTPTPEVAQKLGSAGYRVIVPYLRGYGPTVFRSSDTVRNGQQSALGQDAIALLDSLQVQQAIAGGCDWGARTANIMAALWPDRCKGMVSVSGYLIGNRAAGATPLQPEAEYQWWYQYYFATERGRAGYDKYRREFARLIWRLASPKWRFDDLTFEASAAAYTHWSHNESRDPGLAREQDRR